ncbi:hypothetical protein BTA51_29065 [Hahella sp. CCB-MM4]|nr:hypothetical protein BTA51_29065 [Hahella sp. CCB-MM4]
MDGVLSARVMLIFSVYHGNWTEGPLGSKSVDDLGRLPQRLGTNDPQIRGRFPSAAQIHRS